MARLIHVPAGCGMFAIPDEYAGICNAQENKTQECAAAILWIFEKWLASKQKNARQTESYNESLRYGGREHNLQIVTVWTWMSLDELLGKPGEYLRGYYGYRTVQAAVVFLTDREWLLSKPDPHRHPKRRLFLLNVELVDAAVAAWAASRGEAFSGDALEEPSDGPDGSGAKSSKAASHAAAGTADAAEIHPAFLPSHPAKMQDEPVLSQDEAAKLQVIPAKKPAAIKGGTRGTTHDVPPRGNPTRENASSAGARDRTGDRSQAKQPAEEAFSPQAAEPPTANGNGHQAPGSGNSSAMSSREPGRRPRIWTDSGTGKTPAVMDPDPLIDAPDELQAGVIGEIRAAGLTQPALIADVIGCASAGTIRAYIAALPIWQKTWHLSKRGKAGDPWNPGRSLYNAIMERWDLPGPTQREDDEAVRRRRDIRDPAKAQPRRAAGAEQKFDPDLGRMAWDSMTDAQREAIRAQVDALSPELARLREELPTDSPRREGIINALQGKCYAMAAELMLQENTAS